MIETVLSTLIGYAHEAWAYATPAEPWMWPFSIGILWLLLLSRQARGNAFWLTYAVFPFPFIVVWGLSKIPFFGMPFDWLIGFYRKVMGTQLGQTNVKEVTVGAFGCAIATGILGGNWIGQYWWYWPIYISVGISGLSALIFFIVEKVGGKEMEHKLRNARQGSALALWAKFRGIAKKTVTPKAAHQQGPEGSLECRHCGHLNPDDANCCGNCGLPFQQASVALQAMDL